MSQVFVQDGDVTPQDGDVILEPHFSSSSSSSESSLSESSYSLQGMIFEETFTGDEFDNTWAQSTGTAGIVDGNKDTSTVTGAPASTWAPSCLEIIKPGLDIAFITQINAFSDNFPNVHYLRFDFILHSHNINTNGQNVLIAIAEDYTLSGSNFYILRLWNSGGSLYFRISCLYDGAPHNYLSFNTVDLDTKYRIEVRWDEKEDEWEWKIDGVAQPNNVDSMSPVTSPGTLLAGHNERLGRMRFGGFWGTSPNTITAYFDNIGVYDTGWADEPSSSFSSLSVSSVSVSSESSESESKSSSSEVYSSSSVSSVSESSESSLSVSESISSISSSSSSRSYSSVSSSSSSSISGSKSSSSSESVSSLSISSTSSSSDSESSESSSSQSAISGSKSSISSSESSSSSDSISSTSITYYEATKYLAYPAAMFAPPPASSSSESSESSESSSRSKTGIPVDIHRPNVGDLITLWELHLTHLGGAIYRFTGDTTTSGGISVAITFDGETYYPRSFSASGFGHSGSGQQPRPRIRIADVDGTIHNLCITYQDMLGAIVKRRRTFTRYLDGGVQADPGAELPIDVYTIGKKPNRTKVFVEFELYPYMDKEGKKIPGRLVLKDICQFVYRRWNGTSFDYSSEKPCPYKAPKYFTRDNVATSDASRDDCPHTLVGCQARYGGYGPVPFSGFPGVNRMRR